MHEDFNEYPFKQLLETVFYQLPNLKDDGYIGIVSLAEAIKDKNLKLDWDLIRTKNEGYRRLIFEEPIDGNEGSITRNLTFMNSSSKIKKNMLQEIINTCNDFLEQIELLENLKKFEVSL